MAENITAPFIDGELQSIRQVVSGKNSRIPFLLLPVRTEARFMKVDKPFDASSDGRVERVLGKLAGLEIGFLRGTARLSINQVKKHFTKLIREIQQTQQLSERLPPVTRQQKTWLKDLANGVRTSSQAVVIALSGTTFSTVRKKLINERDQLIATVNAVEAQQDPTFTPAMDYIGQLKKMVQKLENFRYDKLPYTNPKNKRDLYQYIEKTIGELENVYRINDDKIEAIRRIKNNQLQRIRELHGQMKQLVIDLPARINRIYDDNAWKSFVDRTQKQMQEFLPNGLRDFDEVILPKLSFVSQMHHVGLDSLYYRSLRILIEVERFNVNNSIKDFTTVRKSRRKLQRKVEALKHLGKQVFEGDPAQVEALRSLWKRIDKSFNSYEKKLKSFDPKNASHAFGLKTTLNYLNREARPVLKRLIRPKLGEITILTSQAFRDSQTFFHKSAREMKRLCKTVPHQADNAANIERFKKELSQLGNLFRIAGRKRLPIAEAEYQAVKKQYGQLRKIIKRSGQTKDPDIRNELRVIEDALMSTSVVFNRTGTTSFGPSFVLATPTRQVNELWVRIFPDDIHIHSHEAALTAEEIKDGQRFWLAWWAASNDVELEVGAWRAIVTSHGSQRAAWIAKRLDPSRIAANQPNLEKKPSTDIQQAINAIKNATDILSDVTADMDGATIIGSIDGALLKQRINVILVLLNGISFEQTAFLQRAYNELRRLESKLVIIQTQLNAMTAESRAEHQGEIMQIQNAFSAYDLAQQRFQKIEALDLHRFLSRFDKPLRFPRPGRKDRDWSQAPHTLVLPDQFAVLTMTGDRYNHIAVGKQIPKKLNVGLDPQQFEFEEESENPYRLDEEGMLQVDDGMRWMVDFEEAVKKGMGLKIPLTQEEAERGFDRVLVLGIRHTSEKVGQKLLEELIDNHHYAPEGMSFLSVGTPTNNTSDGPSGFSNLDDDPNESYRVEMGAGLFAAGEEDPLGMTDGKRLADALGIDPTVFQHIANSNNMEVSRAQAMHRALWHATIGDYIESSWDHIFTYDNIERTYQFFTANVVGRGILPALRVGTQPYGMLPTTAFSRLRFHKTFNEKNLPKLTQNQVVNPNATVLNRLQVRYDIRLKQFLLIIKSFWDILCKNKVKHAYNLPTTADEGDLSTLPTPQQHFIEMLGLQASSIEHFFRYGINIAYRGPDPEDLGFTVNFEDTDDYGPYVLRNIFLAIMQEGYFYKSFEFDDEQHPSPDETDQQVRRDNRISQQFAKSRIFKSRYLDKHTTISGPIIDTQELSDVNTIEKNIVGAGGGQVSYIQWLLHDADHLYDILERNDFKALPSNAMLFMLLRQSLLLAYREAALAIMQDEGFFTESYRRLIGASDRFRLYHMGLSKYVYTSKWTFLFRDPKTFNGLQGIDFSKKVDGSDNDLFIHLGNGERSLADFLQNKSNLFNSYPRQNQLQKYRDRVDEIREAMAVLDNIPTRALQQLLAEQMDVTSYRLDAWMLGFGNRRLQDQRQKGKKKGIYLGAYGWLEDLRPGGQRDEAVDLPEELQPADRSPVFTDADNEGLIHAPSINQAVAAAVLRSGYTASRESIGDLDNQMAVNLSSRRVRTGLSLIEGVNSGQSLGAILGFQFERGLHESYTIAELDRFIYRFREKFPLVIPVEVSTEQAEANPQANVTDGYNLLQAIDTHIDGLSSINTDQSIFEILTANNFVNCPTFIKTVVDDNLQSGDDRTLILKAIIREIGRIGDALDALGDLVISESVYQVVQGNHVRAAAVVEALATGKAPPEIQFINTPRTGVVVTHRAVLHFERIAATAASAPTGWPATLTPRAKAEPSLNNWLGDIIGPADQILCLGYNESEAPDTPIEIAISKLELQPIDLIYLLGFNSEQGSSELESRLAWHIRSTHSFDSQAVMRLSFVERLDSWSKQQKTIYELTPLILQLKNMLTDVKYVDALDLMIPEDEPELDNPESLSHEDLENRVTAAEADLRRLSADTQTFIDDNFADVNIEEITSTSTQRNQMREFLFNLASYSLPGSVPPSVVDSGDQAGRELFKRLEVALKTMKRRLEAYNAQKAKLEEATLQRRVIDLLIAMGRQLFGKTMVLLPHYQPKNKAAIVQQLNRPADRNLLRHRTDPHVLVDWMQNLASLRPGLYALDLSSMLAQAFSTNFPEFQPVQFPYSENDYWLGLEYPAEESLPEGDYLSLLLFNQQQLTGSDTHKVGILVDEWTEIIPQREEVTGIAFNFDQPDAQAPQNLLLAVSPDISPKWNWDNLVHTLNETLDLAKIRAVEPDHLEESIFAQILPMVISEVAPPQLREYDDDEDDGTDEKPFRNPLGTQVVMDFADNLPKKEE